MKNQDLKTKARILVFIIEQGGDIGRLSPSQPEGIPWTSNHGTERDQLCISRTLC